MSDKIIYKVVTNPGGVDGRSKDLGGKVKFASFDRYDAEKKVDAWSTLKLQVIENFEAEAKKHFDSLDPIEQLLIEWYIHNAKYHFPKSENK